MKRMILSGANGRMGRLLWELAPQAGFEVVAGIDAEKGAEDARPVYAAFAVCHEQADVLVDFSAPSALPELLAFAISRRLPCVLGATGYTESDHRRMAEAARQVPVLYSSNMSPGMHVLKYLAREAHRLLPQLDVEIVERHHRGKVDAPSGTALALYEAVKGEGTTPVFGRHGVVGPRATGEVGLHAVRGGSLAGEHEVGFYGRGEHLLLTHRAEDRTVLAQGALRAAAFVLQQPAGLYGMDNLLPLR